MSAKKLFILFLTGPTATGKTIIADLLGEKYNFAVIHGDHIKRKLFGRDMGVYTQWYKQARFHAEIIKQIALHSRSNKKIAFEYLANRILIGRLWKRFGNSLAIIVLCPRIETDFLRNVHRDGTHLKGAAMQARQRAVEGQYRVLNTLRGIIGKDNYIDTSGETPLQSAERVSRRLKQLNNSPFVL